MEEVEFKYTLPAIDCDMHETYFINKENKLQFLGHAGIFFDYAFLCYGYGKVLINCNIQQNKYFDLYISVGGYNYCKYGKVSEHYLNNVEHTMFFDGYKWWKSIELFKYHLLDDLENDIDYWWDSARFGKMYLYQAFEIGTRKEFEERKIQENKDLNEFLNNVVSWIQSLDVYNDDFKNLCERFFTYLDEQNKNNK